MANICHMFLMLNICHMQPSVLAQPPTTSTTSSNTCMEVVSERYKPNADIVLGFMETLHGSSSDTNLCDLDIVHNIDQTYKAAKILVDYPPNSVRLPNITIGKSLQRNNVPPACPACPDINQPISPLPRH